MTAAPSPGTADGAPVVPGRDEPPSSEVPAITASGETSGVHVVGPSPTSLLEAPSGT